MGQQASLLNAVNLEYFTIGTSQNWRFGIITRDVYRINSNRFEIHDTSHGWQTATVDLATMERLINGAEQLYNLKWQ